MKTVNWRDADIIFEDNEVEIFVHVMAGKMSWIQGDELVS